MDTDMPRFFDGCAGWAGAPSASAPSSIAPSCSCNNDIINMISMFKIHDINININITTTNNNNTQNSKSSPALRRRRRPPQARGP